MGFEGRTTKTIADPLSRWALGLSLIVLLFPSPGWPAMYRCIDSHGASTYTDSPAQLQQCTTVKPGDTRPAIFQVPSPSVPQEQRQPEAVLSIAPAAQHSGDTRAQITVPIQRAGALLVVQTQLNGSRAARLILDTGASHTILSHEIARDLGLLANTHVTSVTLKTAGGTVQAEMTQVGAVQVGEAEAKNVLVAIHDLPDAPPGIDGLLGLTFLQQFLVTLDTQKGELHLKRRE